jgi:hypothetical protein
MTAPARTYRLENNGSRTLQIYLEPWGGGYTLAPGEAADLVVEGPEVHPLHWEFGDGVLVVGSYADTTDAMLSLWRDGVEIPAR